MSWLELVLGFALYLFFGGILAGYLVDDVDDAFLPLIAVFWPVIFFCVTGGALGHWIARKVHD